MYTCEIMAAILSSSCLRTEFFISVLSLMLLKNVVCQDCGTPPYLLNGQVTTPDGTSHPASAVYACNTGFSIVGSTTVQCLNTGSWDTLPVCVADCGTPSSIENGDFVTPSSTLKGSNVTYSCNPGYVLFGKAVVTCQSSGAWTPAPGCQLVLVIFEDNCNISAQCITEGATCRSDGQGGTTCQCAPSGEIYDSAVDACLADCGTLPNPKNGQVILPEQISEGQIAVYTCHVGYTVSDVKLAVRTCLSTGAWSLSAPLCVAGCSNPMPPDHGFVDISEGRTVGSTIAYSCEPGYQLIGVNSRVCRDDTAWSENDPVCLIECPVLPGIEDGSVDVAGGYWEGSVATYECNKNYALVGASTRKCQSTGNWNGVAPSCIFAIFPDALLVVGGLLLFLAIIDILAVAFFFYWKYTKTAKNSQSETENDGKGTERDDEKRLLKEC